MWGKRAGSDRGGVGRWKRQETRNVRRRFDSPTATEIARRNHHVSSWVDAYLHLYGGPMLVYYRVPETAVAPDHRHQPALVKERLEQVNALPPPGCHQKLPDWLGHQGGGSYLGRLAVIHKGFFPAGRMPSLAHLGTRVSQSR